MAIQGYGDSSVKLFIALGKADGTYSEPSKAWEVVPNHVTFHETYMTPLAGDFNGDGYDDVAIWNVDRTTGVTKLWTLTSNGNGGVVRLIPSEWSGPKGTWLASRSKFVTGDFNGDGRDDLGAMYGDSSTGVVRLWTRTTKPDAMFNGALLGWESSPNSFVYGQTHFMHPYYV
jgi:hypothetical protein